MDERIKNLLEIYEKIPRTDCKCCGGCCGPIVWFEPENILISDYLKKHDIPKLFFSEEDFIKNNMRCPYFKDGRCIIYEVRPLVCRLQGVVSDLVCEKIGDNSLLSDVELDDIKNCFNDLLKKFGEKIIFFTTRKIKL